MSGSLAKRYARALAGVARSEGRLEAVHEEIDRAAAWLGDRELADALTSPVLGKDARRALLAQITSSLELSELVKNFLGVLSENHRLELFAGVVRAYRGIVDDELGRVRGLVRTPSELLSEGMAELRKALEAALGKQVILNVEIDPSLLGGLTVEIAGRVYDGSVRTQLQHLARDLARERSPS
jgi:F-type H+-transporting ATPase subunit delta